MTKAIATAAETGGVLFGSKKFGKMTTFLNPTQGGVVQARNLTGSARPRKWASDVAVWSLFVRPSIVPWLLPMRRCLMHDTASH
jgi:hypothetical protein